MMPCYSFLVSNTSFNGLFWLIPSYFRLIILIQKIAFAYLLRNLLIFYNYFI